MLNRHLFTGHETVLVAISGGGDSLALLHLLSSANLPVSILAATVDHGLRPEAAAEADLVHGWCTALGIDHTILKLASPPRSAQQARQARYSALTQHARTVGATAIVLAHTLDDQAETVLMRALRMKSDSDTRGLAAMTPLTRLADIDLLRPLLATGRNTLRRYLEANKQSWIQDPSNEDLASERIRIRLGLGTCDELPSSETLARLAGLCARLRTWLSKQAETAASDRLSGDGSKLCLHRTKELPKPILMLLLANAVRTLGARAHLPAPRTLESIVTAVCEGRRYRHAVGGCVVTADKNALTVQRESPRRNKPSPATTNPATWFVGAPDLPLHAAFDRLCNSSVITAPV